MIPWIHLHTANIPGGGELRLMRRGAEFSIMQGTNELMNSRLSGSERALATLAGDQVRSRPDARVLIGGLGMGFTLRAALEDFSADAKITVAELVPDVVAWARGPMAHIFGDCLIDTRVEVRECDVGEIITAARSAYDAILLDVDNGPDGLDRADNDKIYAVAGLTAARRALRPGGVLAVWSSAPSQPFVRRLASAGFHVEEVQVRATGGRRGGRHIIWLATPKSPSAFTV